MCSSTISQLYLMLLGKLCNQSIVLGAVNPRGHKWVVRAAACMQVLGMRQGDHVVRGAVHELQGRAALGKSADIIEGESVRARRNELA